jgi:hypothetical protein
MWDAVVGAGVGGKTVAPEQARRINQNVQVIPGDGPFLNPTVTGIDHLIFGLMNARERPNHGNIDEIQNLGFAAVLVLALIEVDFRGTARAHGAYPTAVTIF